MRNHLTNALFHLMDSPAPKSEYVFLYANGIPMGVLLLIEEVDENFLKRNGRKENSVYNERKYFLARNTLFDKKVVSNFYCSKPFASPVDRNVIFRVTSSAPQIIYLHYTRNFSNFLNSLILFDDGQHSNQQCERKTCQKFNR